MRMLLKIRLPHAEFNKHVKAGTVGPTMQKILAELKPEAAYFTELDGHRTGLLIVDLKEASGIPALAEPWFLLFGADVELHPVMTAEDLGRSGLDTIAKKWMS